MTKRTAMTTLGLLLALALTAGRADAGGFIPLSVTITSPTNGQAINSGDQVTIKAKIQYDYTLSRSRRSSIRTTTARPGRRCPSRRAPRGMTWQSATWTAKTGTTSIKVRATDSSNATASDSVNITVNP